MVSKRWGYLKSRGGRGRNGGFWGLVGVFFRSSGKKDKWGHNHHNSSEDPINSLARDNKTSTDAGKMGKFRTS